jgi:Flp pilus assembly pilin Flp
MKQLKIQEMKESIKKFWKDEEGLGTLEILLIIAVLVAIAIVFRKWIVGWFQNLINGANDNLQKSRVTPNVPPSPNP